MNNEETPNTNATTFSTWGRVAEEQLERMGEMMTQGTRLQAAALEQGKQLLEYNMKLAGDCQTWAEETRRKLGDRIFSRGRR
tara:strand:- start:75659 stop:75904 length:246 start_codon:yes stop_codon:yes gene_type:complete